MSPLDISFKHPKHMFWQKIIKLIHKRPLFSESNVS